jgi:hypothetical protein
MSIDVPENYGKLPDRERNRLRKAWRGLAAKSAPDQRATTVHGAPYPLRSWPPDAAIDIQNLAEWADRDTGWRNITALLINGWTAPSGSVELRRIGPHCHMRVWYLKTPTTWANTAIAVVAGFATSKTTYGYIALSSMAPTTVSMNTHPTNVLQVQGTPPAAGSTLTGSLTWVSDELWPSTLPGTPA